MADVTPIVEVAQADPTLVQYVIQAVVGVIVGLLGRWWGKRTPAKVNAVLIKEVEATNDPAQKAAIAKAAAVEKVGDYLKSQVDRITDKVK